jgi:protein SCO1/2
MSRLPRFALPALVAVLAAVLGAVVALNANRPESPRKALVLDTPRPLPRFNLTDHTGAPFDLARLEGHWTLMFFGFTHCPDVCPTTLFTLARVEEQLDGLPDRDKPEVVMVSVDPNRDTPEALAAYVPYFDPGFVGVTGDMPGILGLTQSMGVAFAYTPVEGSEDGYAVDHTASIFLVDPAGRLAAIFGTPHTADAIAHDYRLILETRE